MEQNFKLKTKTKTGRNQKIRVDVVVLDSKDNCVFAIEVKNTSRTDQSHTRQYQKYTDLGLPFDYCFGEDEVEGVCMRAKILAEG